MKTTKQVSNITYRFRGMGNYEFTAGKKLFTAEEHKIILCYLKELDTTYNQAKLIGDKTNYKGIEYFFTEDKNDRYINYSLTALKNAQYMLCNISKNGFIMAHLVILTRPSKDVLTHKDVIDTVPTRFGNKIKTSVETRDFINIKTKPELKRILLAQRSAPQDLIILGNVIKPNDLNDATINYIIDELWENEMFQSIGEKRERKITEILK